MPAVAPRSVTPIAIRDTSDGPATPALRTKSSKTRNLAAMFEQGASREGSPVDRALRRDATGSVKNLADRYESQSRSVTPSLLASPERRSNARSVHDDHTRSESPRQDIDFAATVAAGLKESGFDENYVVNDPVFHRSTSSLAVRDIAADDDIATAKDHASTSKFASRGWTPTSSPRLRPIKPSDTEVLPPIEVAIASTDILEAQVSSGHT